MRRLFWSTVSAIVYTLVGYPLLVALLARLVPRPWQRGPIVPRVSLIIAACDEADWIEQKLANTHALDYPPDRLQILVVADGSTDATPDLVRAAEPGVVLLYEPRRRGKAAAMNRAVEHADGEVLVFSDANALYAPDALRRLVASFVDQEVAVVTGAKMVDDGQAAFGSAEALYWRYEGWIRANESMLGQTTGFNGEILAVRRTDWQPLPPGTVNDDFVIGLGAIARGRRAVFEPAARASEPSTLRAADEVTRRSRMLAGRWQALDVVPLLCRPPRPVALWQFVSHKLVRAVLPLFLGLAMLANAGTVLTRPTGGLLGRLEWLAFAGQCGALALVGLRCRAGSLPGPFDQAARLAAYLLVSQWASLIGFARWLRGGQSAAWTRVARRPPSPGAVS